MPSRIAGGIEYACATAMMSASVGAAITGTPWEPDGATTHEPSRAPLERRPRPAQAETPHPAPRSTGDAEEVCPPPGSQDRYGPSLRVLLVRRERVLIVRVFADLDIRRVRMRERRERRVDLVRLRVTVLV